MIKAYYNNPIETPDHGRLNSRPSETSSICVLRYEDCSELTMVHLAALINEVARDFPYVSPTNVEIQPDRLEISAPPPEGYKKLPSQTKGGIPGDYTGLERTPEGSWLIKEHPAEGSIMPDGTVFAGFVPGTDRFMYTTEYDEQLTFTFNEAAENVARLNAQNYLGYNDWRAPTKDELNVLYQNRNKGKLESTFNETGLCFEGWYWSSLPWEELDSGAWGQSFRDGQQSPNLKSFNSRLRCVRG